MVYRRVKLGREVPTGILEKILLEAVSDVGWKAKMEDSYRIDYRLGSLHQEREYRWTDIKLKGSFLPLGEITFYKNRSASSDIGLNYGFGFGVATTKEIERYLLAVSKRIEAL